MYCIKGYPGYNVYRDLIMVDICFRGKIVLKVDRLFLIKFRMDI